MLVASREVLYTCVLNICAHAPMSEFHMIARPYQNLDAINKSYEAVEKALESIESIQASTQVQFDVVIVASGLNHAFPAWSLEKSRTMLRRPVVSQRQKQLFSLKIHSRQETVLIII